MKKILVIITSFIFVISLIYFVPSLIPFSDFIADYNTDYAKNFSKEKFNQVKQGMTKQEVKNILGEPLKDDGAFHYSKSRPQYKTIPPFAADIWWIDAIVTFDNEKVMAVARNKFHN